MRLFEDVGRATESSPVKKVISVIWTVVSKAVDKDFQHAAFYMTVEQVIHKCVSEPQIIGSVATLLTNALAFTVAVAKLIKHKVEKSHRKSQEEKNVCQTS